MITYVELRNTIVKAGDTACNSAGFKSFSATQSVLRKGYQYSQNSDQKDRTDSELPPNWKLKMEYCSNWNYEQIDVAQSTKGAQNG